MKLGLLSSKSIRSLFLSPSRSGTFFSWHPTGLAAFKSWKWCLYCLHPYARKFGMKRLKLMSALWNSRRAKCRKFNEILAINLWMPYVVNPRARGDMKFPVSKQPCIIMFLCLFLRLFCAMWVTGFLRSEYIIFVFFVVSTFFKETTVTAGNKKNRLPAEKELPQLKRRLQRQRNNRKWHNRKELHWTKRNF